VLVRLEAAADISCSVELKFVNVPTVVGFTYDVDLFSKIPYAASICGGLALKETCSVGSATFVSFKL